MDPNLRSRSSPIRNLLMEDVSSDTDLSNSDIEVEEPPADLDPHTLQHLPGSQIRRCVVCPQGRSRYWCPGCNSGVHQKCFHKLRHFWRAKKGGRKRQLEESSDSESD